MQKTNLRRLLSTSFAIAATISISAPIQLNAQDAADAAVKEAEATVKEAEATVKEAEATVKEAEATAEEAEATAEEAEATAKEAEATVEEAEATVEEAEEAETEKLEVGDKTPVFATEDLEWIKGDPIKELNEPGKLYMIECWATWCGPCVVAIPHINELHNNLKDKGLVVIGMNVLEDDLETVKKFTTEQGDKMSYPVAFSGGAESEFSKTWLDAAGVDRIPNAFFVKNGVLIAIENPANVDDELINEFMSADFDHEAYKKKQAAKEARQAEINAKLMPLFQNEDWAGLKTFANEELSGEDDKKMRDNLLGMAAIGLGEWDVIVKNAAAAENDIEKEQLFGQAAFASPTGDDSNTAAAPALEIFTKEKVENAKNNQESLMVGLVRVRYLTFADKKEEAKTLLQSLKKIEFENPQMKTMATKIFEKAGIALEKEAPMGPIQSFIR